MDVILVADGHSDEVGSTDEIAIKTGAKIVTTWEMWFTWFEPRKVPAAQLLRSNPGELNRIDGVTIRNVNSVHGSGTPDKAYGGAAMGFMITFENGLTVYFAGSTALTMDMQLWGMLYKPDVAILPLLSRSDPKRYRAHGSPAPNREPKSEDNHSPPSPAEAVPGPGGYGESAQRRWPSGQSAEPGAEQGLRADEVTDRTPNLLRDKLPPRRGICPCRFHHGGDPSPRFAG
ncbi:MAG: MBL fold metallo-hydrolase [Candidatus Rokubacteria bacterium]|nr:MBL fold metallo-hydrolase [Candidatus Rokubacteria bacterium]